MQPWDFKYTLPNVEEIDESEFEPLPKLQVSTCTIKYIMAQGSIEASQNLEKLPLNRPMPPSNSKLVSAKICAVEILTGPMSINETRLITLSINSKSRDEMQHLLGAVPEAGDSIGVYCRNDPMLSTLAIQLLALDPDCSVYITSDTVIPKDSRKFCTLN